MAKNNWLHVNSAHSIGRDTLEEIVPEATERGAVVPAWLAEQVGVPVHELVIGRVELRRFVQDAVSLIRSGSNAMPDVAEIRARGYSKTEVPSYSDAQARAVLRGVEVKVWRDIPWYMAGELYSAVKKHMAESRAAHLEALGIIEVGDH